MLDPLKGFIALVLWYYVLRYIVFERGLPSSVTAPKISKMPLDNSKVKQLSQGRIENMRACFREI